ncbi:hypothetical protein H5368_04575 [Luteimonas sp. MC1782]|uniref:hypothetical protein n=1 Tax=Luteimonas sp. MC1782 TaxID=2760305 RepID=UPI001600BAE5|nr:hypothetical protein [Luteimonas sp. MC1782]MBB1472299.1 hypothetical protein [Luteimonas sp. MC1782]
MAVNRPQASELLNMSEMRLFDDSRPSALRAMTRAALAARVARARAARDRARDLLKRQKQAARARGDVAGGRTETALRTERKEALLVDILQRFVEARREAPAAAAASRATPAGKTATPAAARAAPAKRAAKTTRVEEAAKATAPAKATKTIKTTKTTKTTKATKATKALTPRKALANTRKLLAAKQQRDREAQPWQSLDPTTSHVPDAGYQSPEAKAKALELHAAESRQASIHGSMSARDRHAQGRRDHRGDTD